MKFVYFEKGKHEDYKVTLPNAITAARAIGGIVLGYLLYKNSVSPEVAAGAVLALGISDAEGTLIEQVNKQPKLNRIRDALRIVPSKIGRVFDPVADKIATLGVVIGGFAGGELSPIDALPIIASEVAITGYSAWREKRGDSVNVNRYGKAGLLTKGSAVLTSFTANALEGGAHDVFQLGGHVLTAAAVVLAAMNIYQMHQEQSALPPAFLPEEHI